MKSIVLVALIGLCSSLGFSQGVEFSDINFKEALKQSSEQDKPIFLDFYATWCGPCKMMDKRVFSLEEVGSFMNSEFISLKLDVEKGEGKPLANQYAIKAMPTYIVIDEEGEVIHRVMGYLPQKKFEEEVEYAVRKYKKSKGQK